MIYKPILRGKNRKKLHNTTHNKFVMDGIPLEQVHSLKFLGVILNDRLT